MNILNKFRSEFLRAIRNKKYEETDGGILLPAQKLIVSGIYSHNVNGEDEREDGNLVTTEGLVYQLDVALNNGTKLTPWYVAISSANVSPQAGWTAANYTSNATEITSNTDGYSQTTRPTFSPTNNGDGTLDNYSSRAAFTIALTGASLVVWGAGMLSSNVKGGTAGKLMSATKFAASRTLYDGDTLNIGYRITLQSA